VAFGSDLGPTFFYKNHGLARDRHSGVLNVSGAVYAAPYVSNCYACGLVRQNAGNVAIEK